MNTKHTPGPWKIKAEISDKFIVGHGFGIANVARWADSNGEDKANATLIAAAPDLLEALKRLMGNESNRDHWIYAQEAIAKAEGP